MPEGCKWLYWRAQKDGGRAGTRGPDVFRMCEIIVHVFGQSLRAAIMPPRA